MKKNEKTLQRNKKSISTKLTKSSIGPTLDHEELSKTIILGLHHSAKVKAFSHKNLSFLITHAALFQEPYTTPESLDEIMRSYKKIFFHPANQHISYETLSREIKNIHIISNYVAGDQAFWQIISIAVMHKMNAFLVFFNFTFDEFVVKNLTSSDKNVKNTLPLLERMALMKGYYGNQPHHLGHIESFMTAQSHKHKHHLNPSFERSHALYSDKEAPNAYLDQTLSDPDEIWEVDSHQASDLPVYHFLKHFFQNATYMWYVAKVGETEHEDEIELIDHFLNDDPMLIQSFRYGTQRLAKNQIYYDVLSKLH